MITCGNLKLNSIDYIVVIDKNYNVIFNTRYEPRVNSTSKGRDKVKVRNLFDAYPSVDVETSSFVECITTGENVVRMYQTCIDYKGEPLCTNNITIPIIRKGEIMGAIEIARDATTVDVVKTMESIDLRSPLASTGEKTEHKHEEIITNNTTMIANIEKAKMYAKLPNPTLIYGETGTGKELYAQLIITESGVSSNKIVTQNCAAVPENLIESTLFGTHRGAYTGAENRKGLFEEADGGILFLDELSTIPYDVQGKLLRVVQEGTFRPVGANTEQRVNVKIIAAMNVDPLVAMENHTLRKDLFYRFSSNMIELLPLRERPEDIEYYITYFVEKFNAVYGKKIEGVSDELRKMLMDYAWEGNVREFRHTIESMICSCKSNELCVDDLPNYVYERLVSNENQYIREKIVDSCNTKTLLPDDELDLRIALEKEEQQLIEIAMDRADNNKSKASKLLGIPRQTLNYKLSKYNKNVIK